MSVFTVNDFAAPAPTTLTVQLEDARFSAQTALSGRTHVSRAAIKRRISVFWAYMPQDHLLPLLSAVSDQSACTVSFPDPLTGDLLSIPAYAVHRSVGLYRMQNGAPVWTNIEMTFMES